MRELIINAVMPRSPFLRLSPVPGIQPPWLWCSSGLCPVAASLCAVPGTGPTAVTHLLIFSELSIYLLIREETKLPVLACCQKTLKLVRCGRETAGQRGRDTRQHWPAPKTSAWEQQRGCRSCSLQGTQEHKVDRVPTLCWKCCTHPGRLKPSGQQSIAMGADGEKGWGVLSLKAIKFL